MKTDDIVEGNEYVIMVPMRVRVVEKGIPMSNGSGGSRNAGVACRAVEGNFPLIVRCDRIKNPEDPESLPKHRSSLA